LQEFVAFLQWLDNWIRAQDAERKGKLVPRIPIPPHEHHPLPKLPPLPKAHIQVPWTSVLTEGCWHLGNAKSGSWRGIPCKVGAFARCCGPGQTNIPICASCMRTRPT
jgi:hypothetical protein